MLDDLIQTEEINEVLSSHSTYKVRLNWMYNTTSAKDINIMYTRDIGINTKNIK